MAIPKDSEARSSASIPPGYRGSYFVDPKEGFVVRRDTPNIRLFVDRGLTVLEKERDTYPMQAIFVDGVYKGAPFMDNERRHYGLDHHVGCVRPFTLASCEQAAVMVLRGLPLAEGIWNLYINEPDLDALMASWVLINHKRLVKDERRLMREVMPLIRVEGLIDTHGLDMAALSGLPSHVYKLQKARLDELRAPELEMKSAGQWENQEPSLYVSEQLDRIDRRVIGRSVRPDAPPSADGIGEVAWPQRRVAVLCRSSQGIYEVQEELKQKHGRALGVIVLDRGGGRMSLLQVDPFMQRSLDELYPLLNERDASANAEDNAWGGSAEIGGTPRKTGTALTGQEVLNIISTLFAQGRVNA